MPPTVSRVTRSKAEAKAGYNGMSKWYDAVSGSSEKKYRDTGLQKLAAQPGEHILEIGFGTGHCLLALAQAVGENGHVYGLDISEGMRDIAQTRLQQAGVAERATLHIGDAAETLPASDLDAIFMSFTLELFDTPEIPQVLQQCYAALKPGGRIGVVSLEKTDAFAVRLYEWFHEKMPATVDCRPIYAQAALREAGFEIDNLNSMVMWGLPVEIVLAKKPRE
jgi:demethylmenaquinone methyltransferase/2-methoxy-6-polyprenyl-1,4-benzoquinol methylase